MGKVMERDGYPRLDRLMCQNIDDKAKGVQLRKARRDDSGFTLLELLVVVALVAIMAALGYIQLSMMTRRSHVASVASDLRSFRMAFILYNLENGAYPNDNNMQLPAGMETLINEQVFEDTTPLGGNYNWEGPDFYPYAGISLTNSPAPAEEVQMLDRMLDDGNVNTGSFQVTPNGRPTYIIEDGI